MIRSLLVATALLAAAPAQFLHNVQLPANTCVIDWNGRLALLIVNRGSWVASFNAPQHSTYNWRLDVSAAAVLDSRPCTLGRARYSLSFYDYHIMGPTLPLSGQWVGPMSLQMGWNSSQPHPTIWTWSYCGMVNCSVPQSCATGPEMQAVVAYPVLL